MAPKYNLRSFNFSSLGSSCILNTLTPFFMFFSGLANFIATSRLANNINSSISWCASLDTLSTVSIGSPSSSSLKRTSLLLTFSAPLDNLVDLHFWANWLTFNNSSLKGPSLPSIISCASS